MKRKSSKTASFLLAFFISACVLTGPAILALLYLSAPPQPAQNFVQDQYRPRASDALTLFITLAQSREASQAFVLVKADPMQEEILLAVLPPDCVVENSGRFSTLGTVFREDGAQRAAMALSRTVGAHFDRQLVLNAKGLESLINTGGSVDCNLDTPFFLSDGTLIFAEGRQLLDGRKLSSLVFSLDEQAMRTQRLNILEDALVAWVNQHIAQIDAAQAKEMFNIAANAGEGNMGISDFESRRQAMAYLAAAVSPAKRVNILGSYEGQEEKRRFFPSAQTVRDLADAFADELA